MLVGAILQHGGVLWVKRGDIYPQIERLLIPEIRILERWGVSHTQNLAIQITQNEFTFFQGELLSGTNQMLKLRRTG